MKTPEGEGRARKLWLQYRSLRDRHITPALTPFVRPAVEPVARQMVEDLFGFWLLWHLYGGFEGLEKFGMHPSTIWRKIARFRKMTGQHPDVFRMPGVEIDPEAYWAAANGAE